MAVGTTGRVEEFYERHPINAELVAETLRLRGVAPRDVTHDMLQEFDQDHLGGITALDRLAARAGIQHAHVVVDLGSGIGGSARHLAHSLGCRVIGIDLTHGRHDGAVQLTRLAKLAHRVSFCRADVRDTPFPDQSFDVAISQDSFVHVPDKPRLFAEALRVVRRGGVLAFTDVVCRRPLPPQVAVRLDGEMAYSAIESADGYARLLQDAGFLVAEVEDLSEEWGRIAGQRLETYRSLQPAAVAKYGEDHYARYDAACEHLVSLHAEGTLGGARIIARKTSA